ncbi:hypothetical protein MPH_04494 [Macrophomina phaseolina MS6]|uniref:BZIP domain-containing protein n=1 Tax=Macrophomina phaseolina (strain MS6) TaxID=1126212 RepID=K2S764_MACPH|nr:hypothetical protein MPH_04494 [Macrophomina phaseolina MS6]
MGSESEERPSKKRARNSTPAEPGIKGKKQRGRPKVDTQDETAADRRRTQIRLAQRAYRQRKESTISSLQKQVEQLQSVIDGMNNSFLRFNDQAMASDIFALRPSLASELKQTTETFVNLAKTAKTVASEDEREDSQEADEPPAEQAAPTPNISSRNYQDMQRPQQDTTPAPNFEARINAQSTHIGLGYYKIPEESEATAYGQKVDLYSGLELPNLQASHLQASRDPSVTESRQFQALPPSYPFGGIDELNSVNVFRPEDFAQEEDRNSKNASVVPARTRSYQPFTRTSTVLPSPMTSSVPPTFTYSFQETTFARRLQRACLERAFHLLSTAHLRPSDFNRVFRLCRHYSSREDLLSDFRKLLQQSVLQPLDFINSPFLHLGGAGTHYPARDEHGRAVPDSADSDWNIRRIGPWATRAQREELRRSNRPEVIFTQELEEDMVAYGGEWFDSHDVEGYLEELGVHIDAQASFAEAAVRTLDALARGPTAQADFAHPDSEMAVLGEPLDQFAPNHLAAPSLGVSPSSQSPHAATSPSQASLPGSASVPSATQSGHSASNSPSTPDSVHVVQPAERIANQSPAMTLGNDFQPVDPKSYDEWDRYYDLSLAWMGSNQADLSDYGLGDVATVQQVDERRQNRTVTIDVQRFINGLIKRGVCIGRGPGFRRADVHYALRAAIIEAF